MYIPQWDVLGILLNWLPNIVFSVIGGVIGAYLHRWWTVRDSVSNLTMVLEDILRLDKEQVEDAARQVSENEIARNAAPEKVSRVWELRDELISQYRVASKHLDKNEREKVTQVINSFEEVESYDVIGAHESFGWLLYHAEEAHGTITSGRRFL